MRRQEDRWRTAHAASSGRSAAVRPLRLRGHQILLLQQLQHQAATLLLQGACLGCAAGLWRARAGLGGAGAGRAHRRGAAGDVPAFAVRCLASARTHARIGRCASAAVPVRPLRRSGARWHGCAAGARARTERRRLGFCLYGTSGRRRARARPRAPAAAHFAHAGGVARLHASATASGARRRGKVAGYSWPLELPPAITEAWVDVPFCARAQGCQRYWTAGGTLRNVPPGAGRRKNKGGSAEEEEEELLSAQPQRPAQPPQPREGSAEGSGTDAVRPSTQHAAPRAGRTCGAGPRRPRFCKSRKRPR